MYRDELDHDNWLELYSYVQESTGLSFEEALSFMEKYDDLGAEIIFDFSENTFFDFEVF